MAANNNIDNSNNAWNVLTNGFPDFLSYVFPYIADRTVWNSIASSNKDMNKKSKSISPPWPTDYQLPASNVDSVAVWSPDGTRVAYTSDVISMVDQRHGIIHRINNNGVIVSDLKFSPDGRLLVSVGDDDIVTAWDIHVAGNAKPLQIWNIKEDFPEIGMYYYCSIDISPCGKYIVMASSDCWSNRVIVKSVENGGTVQSLTPQPSMMCINEVMFSVDGRAVFICGHVGDSNVIKLWRPYLDDADEDSLITLWEQKSNNLYLKIIVSHDKMMIAIQDSQRIITASDKGRLLSIDNNYNCTTVHGLNFERSEEELLQFTPDDKCIIYYTKNRLKYWSVVERKFTDNTYLLYNERTMNKIKAVNCSPNNRQLIVAANNKEGVSLYMKSMSRCNHGCTKEEFNSDGEHCKVLEDWSQLNRTDEETYTKECTEFYENHQLVLADPIFGRYVIAHIADDFLKSKKNDIAILTYRLLLLLQIRYVNIPKQEGKDVGPDSEYTTNFNKYSCDIMTDRGRINCIAREIPCDCMQEKKIEADTKSTISGYVLWLWKRIFKRCSKLNYYK